MRDADGRPEHIPAELAGQRGVGLADSFNIIIISFFAAIDLGTTVVVAFSLAKRNGKRARAATRQSLALMMVLSLVLVFAIEQWGHLIIDLIAGGAEPKVKELALSYLKVSAWSYPAAARCAGQGTPKSRC